MTRLIFDFPESDGVAQRRTFINPREIISATSVRAVEPALRRVEALCAGGAWAAGYISYEAAPAFDAAMRVHDASSMPLLQFGIFDACDVGSSAFSGTVASAHMSWTETTSPSAFIASVERIREAIAAGETYQVNYTTRLRSSLRGDAYALYESLRSAQGAGWHSFLELDEWTIVSASPELFFRKCGSQLTTRPMKGTRPRGRWRSEDASLAHDLQDSAKDRAENLMIVDLLRNDVGHIAETGSVSVTGLYSLEAYETVWQLTSTVAGLLRDDVSLYDIFAALFPCGSVTGAPKINTMKWIASLEETPREVYCGAIGFVQPGGDCAFSVPIRTVWIDRASAACTYGVGAGITIDSDPQDELDEVRAKSQVLQGTPHEFELLETMRCENGSIVRFDRHMDRLMASAEYFGFEVRREDVEVACTHAAYGSVQTMDGGIARLRLLVTRDGRCSTTTSDAPAPFTTRDATRDMSPLARVSLAHNPVSSRDRFLCHKTTCRRAYDERRVADTFDTLLFNEKNEVTEFTIGNAVFEIDGALVTPARLCGLLNGVFRQELLDTGVIAEAVIGRGELRGVGRTWLINSLREWVEVELMG